MTMFTEVCWTWLLTTACFFGLYTGESTVHWPNGPYALITPKYGCPESGLRGWSRSYINMTFTLSRNLYPTCHKTSGIQQDVKPVTSDETEITSNNTVASTDKVNLYAKYSYILGPFDDLNFQLNFCFKNEKEFDKDGSRWPDGNYSVFGADRECPTGFTVAMVTLCLPPLLNWNYDGYLPYFHLDPGGGVNATRLELMVCTRDNASNTETSMYPTNDAIMLMKADQCPSYMVDIGYPYPVYTDQGLEMRFCLQHANNRSETECSITTEDKTEVHIYKSIVNMEECRHLPYAEPCDVVDWLMLDLGRAITIAAVTILPLSMYYIDYMASDDHLPKLIVSNLQWSFSNNGGPECNVVDKYMQNDLLNNYGVRYVCSRGVRGRYVMLHFNYNGDMLHYPAIDYRRIRMYVSECDIEEPVPRDFEPLGMMDGNIRDYQISASSSTPGYTAIMARPESTGWCPDNKDTRHYLQVDLIASTTIGGVTVYNMELLEQKFEQNTYSRVSKLRGSDSFSIMFGDDLDKMEFYSKKGFQLDKSRPYEEPQTFEFFHAINARYIQIIPALQSNPNLTCLRLEIHGGRKKGIHSIKCTDAEEKQVFETDEAFITDIEKMYYQFDNLKECQAYCLDANECIAVTMSFEQNTTACKLYLLVSPQQPVYSMTKPSTVDYLGQILCREDVSDVTTIALDERTTLYMSPGYPMPHGERQAVPYIWTIDMTWYWKMIFTDIALQELRTEEHGVYICGERIYVGGQAGSFTIKGDDNGKRMMLAPGDSASTSTIVLYETCPSSGQALISGGFRAYLIREDIPTVTVSEFWGGHAYAPAMNVYSHSEMLTDLKEQTFRIKASGHVAIVFTFDEFHVSCDLGEYVRVGDVRYCNSNRPLRPLFLAVTDVWIAMKSDLAPSPLGRGYRAHYSLQSPRHYVSPDTSVYLDETPSRGIIHIRHENGTFGFMCGDIFGENEGKVICRMLGYEGVWEVYQENYAMPAGPIWFQGKECTGFETHISMCVQGYSSGNCYYSNAAVDCRTDEEVLRCYHDKCYHKPLLVRYDDGSNPGPLFTWEDADAHCRANRSTLVTIRNAADYEYVRQIQLLTNTQDGTKAKVFIGLVSRRDSSGRVMHSWLTGQPVTFTAWEAYQSVDAGLTQCTVLADTLEYNTSQLWRTVDCAFSDNAPALIICERPNTLMPSAPSSDDRLGYYNSTRPEGESETLFRCTNGEYISMLAVCNGIAECHDQSDEQDCNEVVGDALCGNNGFQCGSGECIHVSTVCDFIPDCEDRSDEYCEITRTNGTTITGDSTCSSSYEVACSNGECIDVSRHCDAIQDCPEGGDEQFCITCNEAKAFRCRSSSKCIPLRFVCDQTYDCDDQTDEEDCQHLSYRTCDDVLNLGFTQSGIYTTDSGQHIECDFSELASGKFNITMTYHNFDWIQQRNEDEDLYSIDARTVFDAAAKDGYNCQLDFTPVMRTLDAEIASLDGTSPPTHSPIILKYTSDGSVINPLPHQDNHVIAYMLSGNPFVQLTRSFDMDKHRLPECTINCHKNNAVGNWNDFFPCGANLMPIPKRGVCVFELDTEGRTIGCRNLAHLQNCEDVECYADLVKCPASYCIPQSYVCNGRIDCPNGDDELNCFCKDTIGTAIVALYGGDTLQMELAYSIANSLVSTSRRVFIVTPDIVDDFVYIKQLTKPSAVVPLQYGNYSTDVNILTSHNVGEHIGLVSLFTKEAEERTLFGRLGELLNEHPVTVNRLKLSISTEMTKPFTSSQSDVTGLKVSRTESVPLTEVQLRTSEILPVMGPRLYPSLCTGISKATCLNYEYICTFTRICINRLRLCDGYVDCPHGDDERLCHFRCPENCTCDGLAVSCRFTSFAWEDLTDFPHNVKSLDIGNNDNAREKPMQISRQFASLSALNVSYSGVTRVSPQDLANVPHIITLDLRFNRIRVLQTNTFLSLRKLKVLFLEGNRYLKSIEPGAFTGLQITELSLAGCGLLTLGHTSFNGLTLDRLDLSSNKINSIEDLAFSGLHSRVLDLSNNPIQEYSRRIFHEMLSASQLTTDSFKFCCYRPSFVAEDNCYPHADEFSSCDDLMRNTALQALLWIIGIGAVVGNIASVIFRVVYDRERLKIGYGIFVTNLAIADLLMGVYLVIIAVADTMFRKRYVEMDEAWRSSWWCSFCGVISTISSEASVLFMCLITLDRILVIKYPFGQIRITPKIAKLMVLACWLLVIIISVYPLLHTSYFEGRFYTSRAVCVALPLTRDQPPGWLYSVVIFICFNLIAFVLIAFGQSLIYQELKKSAKAVKRVNADRTRDLKVARNLLLIVTTDFLCWFPIGLMGAMALGGYRIPGDVYAWTVVLILPINSAINPVMYTFSVLLSKRAQLNPSTEEQFRSEVTTEHTRAVRTILTRFLKNARKLPNVRPVEVAMTSQNMTQYDVIYVSFHLANLLMHLHDANLVIDTITCQNVIVEYDVTGRVKRGGAVQINSIPKEDDSAKKKADNIHQLGTFIKCLMEGRAAVTSAQVVLTGL